MTIRDALSTVGTAIIYRVDKRDADYLAKDLQEKIKPADLVSLGKGEAFARIGTEIVRIKTRLPLKPPSLSFRNRIIEESHSKYYKPAHEVREWLKHRDDRWHPHGSLLTAENIRKTNGKIKEFIYDEF